MLDMESLLRTAEQPNGTVESRYVDSKAKVEGYLARMVNSAMEILPAERKMTMSAGYNCRHRTDAAGDPDIEHMRQNYFGGKTELHHPDGNREEFEKLKTEYQKNLRVGEAFSLSNRRNRGAEKRNDSIPQNITGYGIKEFKAVKKQLAGDRPDDPDFALPWPDSDRHLTGNNPGGRSSSHSELQLLTRMAADIKTMQADIKKIVNYVEAQSGGVNLGA